MTVGSVVTRCLHIKGRIFYTAALIFMFVMFGLRYLPMVFHDRFILSSVLSMFCAQGIKPLTVKGDEKANWLKAFKCGGMPSSHTAVVAALATSIGLEYGWLSPFFQVAAVLGGIVIYDAITLRRIVGIHSLVLKDLVKEAGDTTRYRLGEMVGHTPIEASVGLLVGVFCALLVMRI